MQMRAAAHQALQGADADTGQRLRGLVIALFGVEGLWMVDAQLCERGLQGGGVGQRHTHARHPRVAGNHRVQIGQLVGKQEARERGLAEGWFAGPVAHQAGQAGDVEFSRSSRRQDLLGAADQHRDVLDVAATHCGEIVAKAHVAADDFHRQTRIARQRRHLLHRRPLGDTLGTAQDPQAIAGIIGEHDLEAAQQQRIDAADQADPTATQRKPVRHVAVENELPVRAALVGERQLPGPLRCVSRQSHVLQAPQVAQNAPRLPR